MLIQWFLILFAGFAVARTFGQFRRGRLPRRSFFFWLFFWVVFATVVFLPWTTEAIARAVGVGRGVDLAIYVSLAVLFYISFRLFVKIEDLEREITKMVRQEALEKLTQKK
jgi:hypothetical protein